MYNKSQQFAADGRRTPLTWRRCAQRYTAYQEYAPQYLSSSKALWRKN